MEYQLKNIDGEELTIAAIQEAMEAGKLTSKELVVLFVSNRKV